MTRRRVECEPVFDRLAPALLAQAYQLLVPECRARDNNLAIHEGMPLMATAAIYARVSSARQKEQQTIQSQTAALLVQFQGMIAEYEKAQIIERTRRGKAHRAKQGSVNVLSGAPYGYRYVRKSDHDQARYELLEPEASIVRELFGRYYRCLGSDDYRYPGGRVCANLPVRADYLDQVIWEHVTGLLADPALVRGELDRRLAKTHLQHVLTALALNLVRVDAWLTGTPLGGNWASRLTRLQPALSPM